MLCSRHRQYFHYICSGPFCADAIMEAADAGIELIVCITEGIPTLDVIKAYRFVQLKGAKLIGPNCPRTDLLRVRVW